MNSYEHAVARAEVNLEAAERRYQETLEDLANVQARVDAVNQRRESIKKDLSSGDLTNKEAGSLLSVADEDLADLRKLLIEASTVCDNAEPIRERQALVEARARLDRARKEEEFEVLYQHIRLIENTLTAALADLWERGRDLGRPSPLNGIWQPTTDLSNAVRFNQPPRKL